MPVALSASLRSALPSCGSLAMARGRDVNQPPPGPAAFKCRVAPRAPEGSRQLHGSTPVLHKAPPNEVVAALWQEALGPRPPLHQSGSSAPPEGWSWTIRGLGTPPTRGPRPRPASTPKARSASGVEPFPRMKDRPGRLCSALLKGPQDAKGVSVALHTSEQAVYCGA